MENRPEQARVLDWLIPNATVFIGSACIMIIELVAGRIISRYLGQSLYTWTSVIGIVLAGISLGNYVGGRIADRFEPKKTLSVLFFLSSFFCLLVPLLNHGVGQWSWLWERTWPTRIITHVFLTFILPSTMLGTISPVVAKMALSKSTKTGRTLGDVYAWGAIGSIVGTFLAGFYLIALLGTLAIIITVAAVLAMIGLLYGTHSWLAYLWTGVCLLAVFFTFGSGDAVASIGRKFYFREAENPNIIYRDESQYSYIAVKENPDNPDERGLYLDKLEHSIIDIKKPDELKYGYTWIYDGVVNRFSGTDKPVTALILGGGGYAFPQYLEMTRPGSRIEVVEIDPAVTKAAFAACGLRRDTKIKTLNMDARNYVADMVREKKEGKNIPEFDYIFGDSVNDFSVPYQLTTREFMEDIDNLLAPDGKYLLNLIEIFDSGKFLGAVVNTCKEVFPYVYVFSTSGTLNARNTFVVVCLKSEANMTDVIGLIRTKHPFEGQLIGGELLDQLKERSGGLVLTDDYAPVENLLTPVVRQNHGEVLEHHVERGVAAAHRGDLQRAVYEFNEAVRINPVYARGYYNLGIAYMEMGQTDDALDNFARALEIEPNYVDARNNAALIFARTGRLKLAVQQWFAVLEVAPTSLDVHNNLGNALAQMGYMDKAVEHWLKAIEINPEYASAHNNLANAFRSQGKNEEAMTQYAEAIRLNPQLAEAQSNYADLLAEQGRVEEAIRYYQAALKLKPGIQQAQKHLDALKSAQNPSSQ